MRISAPPTPAPTTIGKVDPLVAVVIVAIVGCVVEDARFNGVSVVVTAFGIGGCVVLVVVELGNSELTSGVAVLLPC